MKTAVGVAVLVWFLAYFSSNASLAAYGFMPIRLVVVGTVWGLVELLLAGIVGSKLYKDPRPSFSTSTLTCTTRAQRICQISSSCYTTWHASRAPATAQAARLAEATVEQLDECALRVLDAKSIGLEKLAPRLRRRT